jgi:hypothetical protein
MLSASLTRPILNFVLNGDGLLGRVFLCLTFLGILLVAAGLAEVGRLVAERFFGTYRKSANAWETVVVAAMVLTMFALLLAFAIVTLYDQRRDAEAAVAREGNDLAMIARNSTAFGAPEAIGNIHDKVGTTSSSSKNFRRCGTDENTLIPTGPWCSDTPLHRSSKR